MSEPKEREGINPFVTNLSTLNAVFSFTLAIFSFTIILYLKQYGENVLYAGFGLSAGEAVMLLTLLPQGRLIDRGHSFGLMVFGSMAYGISLIFLFYSISTAIFPWFFIPLFIALLIIFQSTFRTSLNSFIAKAVHANVLGSNYARILTMEIIGTSVAFAVFAYAAYFSYLDSVYIYPGLVLVILTILVFAVLSASHRTELQKEESKIRRPNLRESIKGLADKRGFLGPLITSKVFMSIGVIGFTYFYIPEGVKLGIPLTYVSLALLATYILGAVWGKIGEHVVDRHPGLGKAYITSAMFIDIVTFGLIFYSIIYQNIYTFIAAALFSSPGTLLVSGAMSFEAKVIGVENRGMFGAVQRVIVGIVSVFLTFILTYFFVNNTLFMWEIVLASSLASLLFAGLIPSRYSASLNSAPS